jgi:hypothetical protein
MIVPWWQIVIAPIFTLLGVLITMAFNARSQTKRLKFEAEAGVASRAESAERDDRRRFMNERRDAYKEFATAVDAWMIEAETLKQMATLLPESDPDLAMSEEDKQDLLNCQLRIREALNHMTLISPLHVLGAASDVNSSTRDDTSDPVGVQPLLLKFLFECRRDLIGEAFWPSDLAEAENAKNP